MTWTSQPVDCDAYIDPSGLAGKTAIVTGGANGLGKAYVKALHSAKLVKVLSSQCGV